MAACRQADRPPCEDRMKRISVRLPAWTVLEPGTEVRASLDAFAELFFVGGNSRYTRVNHYGYYSIGSPSSATATVPERPEPPGE